MQRDQTAGCISFGQKWKTGTGKQYFTDIIGLSSTAPQLRSAANIREVKVAGSRLQVVPKLKSLGITIDSHLRFDCQAKEVVRACNYHTRALRHMRTVLTDDLAQTVACSIVSSRLDYCNAMLYGAPAATLDTAASAEQPSQGRLPAGRSNQRQTTSQVAPLAASQVSSDIQDGGADVQDDVLLNASIFE